MLPNQPASFSTLYACSMLFWRSLLRQLFILSFFCTLLPILSTQYAAAHFNINTLLLKQAHIPYGKLTLMTAINTLVSLGCFATLLLSVQSKLCPNTLGTATLIKTVLLKLPSLVIAVLIASCAVILGSVVFIIPGFYFLGMIFIFYPIVITQNSNPVDSFIQSYRLIHHHWWRTFFTLILPIILITLFSTLVAIGFSFVTASLTPNALQLTLRSLGQAIVMSFFLPWICIQTLLVLNDLKLRKENTYT